VIPYTIGNFIAGTTLPAVTTDHPAFKEAKTSVQARIDKFMNSNGTKTADEFHKELGHIMWEYVGMSRNEAGLKKALAEIAKLKDEFWKNLKVSGEANELNAELEKAGRVADFLELGELMAYDALQRKESCGGHFREESQTADNEALRDDANFCYVSAWEWKDGKTPELHKEQLEFDSVHLSTRSYK
jgi:succinate dehydrogenase / fumarate reductase flavoprotein subunit